MDHTFLVRHGGIISPSRHHLNVQSMHKPISDHVTALLSVLLLESFAALHTTLTDIDNADSISDSILSGLFAAVQTTLTYIDRSNVSYAALQFKGDLHLDNASYGLGAGEAFCPGVRLITLYFFLRFRADAQHA